MNQQIQNPILKGFHPDPSILRVGDDYYIATSTFEWVPGVRIHHSRDLLHWQPIGYALKNKEELDLTGVMASGGVWAPCLTYNEQQQLFYLVYTIVRNRAGNVFHSDNYVVTAKEITGPYSAPVYLNSSGFDPSIFHDEDGRIWLSQLEWDFRQDYPSPGVIVLQEYDAELRDLVGEPQRIYAGGTDLGCLEAPHIYKRNGYYYLMAAEGGTGYGHAVTMARAKEITGPYESDLRNPIITSAITTFHERGVGAFLKPQYYNPNAPLQKSGHGSLVETSNGKWYVAHLCARPLMPQMRSTLGRETALQAVYWNEEGWLRLEGGGNQAKLVVPAPNLPPYPVPTIPERDDFDELELGTEWNTLRVHQNEAGIDLVARPSHLRLRGQDSLFSVHTQSLVARRVQSFDVLVETVIDFEPKYFQAMAGLTFFYDHLTHYFLRVYYSESLGGKCLGLISSDHGQKQEWTAFRVALPNDMPVYLRGELHGDSLQFSYSLDGDAWKNIGPVFDASKMSDEYPESFEHFTGTFVGVTCIDTYRHRAIADFDYFVYRELN